MSFASLKFTSARSTPRLSASPSYGPQAAHGAQEIFSDGAPPPLESKSTCRDWVWNRRGVKGHSNGMRGREAPIC